MKKIMMILIILLLVGCNRAIENEGSYTDENAQNTMNQTEQDSTSQEVETNNDATEDTNQDELDRVYEVVISIENLNVREGVSTYDEILGQLHMGDVVQVFDVIEVQFKEWYKIRFEGNYAYIAGWFTNDIDGGRNIRVHNNNDQLLGFYRSDQIYFENSRNVFRVFNGSIYEEMTSTIDVKTVKAYKKLDPNDMILMVPEYQIHIGDTLYSLSDGATKFKYTSKGSGYVLTYDVDNATTVVVNDTPYFLDSNYSQMGHMEWYAFNDDDKLTILNTEKGIQHEILIESGIKNYSFENGRIRIIDDFDATLYVSLDDFSVERSKDSVVLLELKNGSLDVFRVIEGNEQETYPSNSFIFDKEFIRLETTILDGKKYYVRGEINEEYTIDPSEDIDVYVNNEIYTIKNENQFKKVTTKSNGGVLLSLSESQQVREKEYFLISNQGMNYLGDGLYYSESEKYFAVYESLNTQVAKEFAIYDDNFTVLYKQSDIYTYDLISVFNNCWEGDIFTLSHFRKNDDIWFDVNKQYERIKTQFDNEQVSVIGEERIAEKIEVPFYSAIISGDHLGDHLGDQEVMSDELLFTNKISTVDGKIVYWFKHKEHGYTFRSYDTDYMELDSFDDLELYAENGQIHTIKSGEQSVYIYHTYKNGFFSFKLDTYAEPYVYLFNSRNSKTYGGTEFLGISLDGKYLYIHVSAGGAIYDKTTIIDLETENIMYEYLLSDSNYESSEFRLSPTEWTEEGLLVNCRLLMEPYGDVEKILKLIEDEWVLMDL